MLNNAIIQQVVDEFKTNPEEMQNFIHWAQEGNHSLDDYIVMKRDQSLLNDKLRQDIEDEQLSNVKGIENVEANTPTKMLKDCPVIDENKEVQPILEYDPHKEYKIILHQPEIHIICDLLNDEISNATRMTPRGQLMIRMRKKFQKRRIGMLVSFENFDRRLNNIPINSKPRSELIGDKVKEVSPYNSLPLFKAVQRYNRSERTRKLRQREREDAERQKLKDESEQQRKLEADRVAKEKADKLLAQQQAERVRVQLERKRVRDAELKNVELSLGFG